MAARVAPTLVEQDALGVCAHAAVGARLHGCARQVAAVVTEVRVRAHDRACPDRPSRRSAIEFVTRAYQKKKDGLTHLSPFARSWRARRRRARRASALDELAALCERIQRDDVIYASRPRCMASGIVARRSPSSPALDRPARVAAYRRQCRTYDALCRTWRRQAHQLTEVRASLARILCEDRTVHWTRPVDADSRTCYLDRWSRPSPCTRWRRRWTPPACPTGTAVEAALGARRVGTLIRGAHVGRAMRPRLKPIVAPGGQHRASSRPSRSAPRDATFRSEEVLEQRDQRRGRLTRTRRRRTPSAFARPVEDGRDRRRADDEETVGDDDSCCVYHVQRAGVPIATVVGYTIPLGYGSAHGRPNVTHHARHDRAPAPSVAPVDRDGAQRARRPASAPACARTCSTAACHRRFARARRRVHRRAGRRV